MFSIKIIWLFIVLQASKCYTFEQYQQQQQQQQHQHQQQPPYYARFPSQQFRNQYQYPEAVNHNHNNGVLNNNCADNFKNRPYAGNNAFNTFNGYPNLPYKTDPIQSHKFNGYKSNSYNDMPRKSNYEEDYITYDTKKQGNNGRGNDVNNNNNNNNKYEQQYDEKSNKDVSKEFKDEKDLSKKSEVQSNDFGSFVKGTYDENYYKTEKRQKRDTPKQDVLFLDFNDKNIPNVEFNRQKLSNLNSKPKSNGNKEFLLDYVIQRIIFRSIRNMHKKRIIQKSYPTNTLVQAVFTNCIKNTDLYKILISNATDKYGVSETFNDYKRWKEIVGVDVNAPNELLIDIILESLIRQTFQWLCENNLIISRYNAEMITNEAFELMKQTNFYQTVLHPEESNSVLNIVNRNNWWLLEGDIWTEGNVKRWSWTSLK